MLSRSARAARCSMKLCGAGGSSQHQYLTADQCYNAHVFPYFKITHTRPWQAGIFWINFLVRGSFLLGGGRFFCEDFPLDKFSRVVDFTRGNFAVDLLLRNIFREKYFFQFQGGTFLGGGWK